jgi:hypothetical protein
VRRALVVLAVAAIPLLAWGARNRAAVGLFTLNTNASVNLALGNGPRTPLLHPYQAMRDSLAFGDLFRIANEAARAHAAQDAARAYMVRHPGRCIALAGAKILDALGPDRVLLGLAVRGQFSARPRGLVLALALAAVALSFPLRALGLASLFAPGDAWPARGMRLGFALTLGMQALTLGHSRFTLLAWMLLVPGAASVFVRARAGERATRRALAIAVAVLALTWGWQALTSWPGLSVPAPGGQGGPPSSSTR